MTIDAAYQSALERFRSSFERALQLSPGFRDATFRIALCRAQLKQYDAALASFFLDR